MEEQNGQLMALLKEVYDDWCARTGNPGGVRLAERVGDHDVARARRPPVGEDARHALERHLALAQAAEQGV